LTTFILIHGAWHGGWCWERVVPLLEKAGHTVIAPDLPGMGQDKTPLANASLSSWTMFVTDVVAQSFEPVVLVGHSRGGIVISEVAQLVPDRIATLVYLAAFLVPDGKTLSDMLAMHAGRPVARDTMVPADDGISVTMRPEKVGPVFYNTTPPELQKRAAEHVVAEPLASFTTPVRTTADRYGRVERAYIECTQDNAIPIELQRLMQQALPCDPVVTLDADHSPFYSMPERLAGALIALAAERR
jgi:pimeloyl-ACP methyl ester carboxylesterase